MGLFSSKKHKQKVKAASGSGRTAEDYNVGNMDDATLQALAADPGRYGEISKFASQELGNRKGLYSQADSYRAALEKATYADAGRQYSQGLPQITNYLARSGPLYDSGAGTALRSKLAGQIYGQAQGQIGGQFADYLGNLLNQNRQFGYQRQLAKYQAKLQKPSPIDYAGAIAGGAAGSYFGG